MRFGVNIFPILLLATALPSLAMQAPLKPNAQFQLAVPPVWDSINRTFYVPEMVAVKQASSLENCSFYGGLVVIKKVTKDLVYFDKHSQSKNLEVCDSLVTSKEKFRDLDIYLVEEQKQQFSRLSSAFRQQLSTDIKNIQDQKDNCVPPETDLSLGETYRLEGEVFWHGTNTAAITTTDSDTCHVEKNGAVEILGFDRTSDFMLAAYHSPSSHVESVEVVDIQLKHKIKRTCRNEEKIVLPVKKVRSQFKLTPTRKKTGIMEKFVAIFKRSAPKVKICAAGNT